LRGVSEHVKEVRDGSRGIRDGSLAVLPPVESEAETITGGEAEAASEI
jgi:hypothetical protein